MYQDTYTYAIYLVWKVFSLSLFYTLISICYFDAHEGILFGEHVLGTKLKEPCIVQVVEDQKRLYALEHHIVGGVGGDSLTCHSRGRK